MARLIALEEGSDLFELAARVLVQLVTSVIVVVVLSGFARVLVVLPVTVLFFAGILFVSLLLLLFLTALRRGSTSNSQVASLEQGVVLTFLRLFHFSRSVELNISDSLSDKGVLVTDDSDVQDLATFLKVCAKVFLIYNPGKISNED